MSHRYWAIFWVHKRVRVPEYGSRFPSTGPILGIYLGPGSRVRVQVPEYRSRFPSTVRGWSNISDSYGKEVQLHGCNCRSAPTGIYLQRCTCRRALTGVHLHPQILPGYFKHFMLLRAPLYLKTFPRSWIMQTLRLHALSEIPYWQARRSHFGSGWAPWFADYITTYTPPNFQTFRLHCTTDLSKTHRFWRKFRLYLFQSIQEKPSDWTID